MPLVIGFNMMLIKIALNHLYFMRIILRIGRFFKKILMWFNVVLRIYFGSAGSSSLCRLSLVVVSPHRTAASSVAEHGLRAQGTRAR